MIRKNLKVANLPLILNWEQILNNEENDANFSMNKYLSKIHSLLDTHAPLKKCNKKELKLLTKPRSAKFY